jgi:prophage regulatory protein
MATEKLLRLSSVEDAVGYRRSTIYKLIAEGKFPASISLGARAVAWPQSSIESWIQQRIEQSRKTA